MWTLMSPLLPGGLLLVCSCPLVCCSAFASDFSSELAFAGADPLSLDELDAFSLAELDAFSLAELDALCSFDEDFCCVEVWVWAVAPALADAFACVEDFASAFAETCALSSVFAVALCLPSSAYATDVPAWKIRTSPATMLSSPLALGILSFASWSFFVGDPDLPRVHRRSGPAGGTPPRTARVTRSRRRVRGDVTRVIQMCEGN